LVKLVISMALFFNDSILQKKLTWLYLKHVHLKAQPLLTLAIK